VLLSTSRCSQPPLDCCKVLSDSARAFTGTPESTCSYGGAFRMLRDLTIRILKFWSCWDLCAGLRETSRAAGTTAQVCRRLREQLRPQHKLCRRLDALFSHQWFVGFHNHKHQPKTFPSGQNGSIGVDTLRPSRQRHHGAGFLCVRRQYHASRCTSPSDRSFAVSSSDSARAFSDAPESTCSYGGAFRTLQDLTIRIVNFWSSWDRCAALQETWCRILKAVVLMVP